MGQFSTVHIILNLMLTCVQNTCCAEIHPLRLVLASTLLMMSTTLWSKRNTKRAHVYVIVYFFKIWVQFTKLCERLRETLSLRSFRKQFRQQAREARDTFLKFLSLSGTLPELWSNLSRMTSLRLDTPQLYAILQTTPDLSTCYS